MTLSPSQLELRLSLDFSFEDSTRDDLRLNTWLDSFTYWLEVDAVRSGGQLKLEFSNFPNLPAPIGSTWVGS